MSPPRRDTEIDGKGTNTCEGTQDHLHYRCQSLLAPSFPGTVLDQLDLYCAHHVSCDGPGKAPTSPRERYGSFFTQLAKLGVTRHVSIQLLRRNARLARAMGAGPQTSWVQVSMLLSMKIVSPIRMEGVRIPAQTGTQAHFISTLLSRKSMKPTREEHETYKGRKGIEGPGTQLGDPRPLSSPLHSSLLKPEYVLL
uniref:Uncharacterized protein n=1 Tax=Oryza punctata TaxID=4537 RepID=A0A0E0JIL9_ORYPU